MRAALHALCITAVLLEGTAFHHAATHLHHRTIGGLFGRCRLERPSGGRRSGVFIGLRMMEQPPPPPPPLDFEDENEEPPPRPKVNWGDRFKRALDMNPGRSNCWQLLRTCFKQCADEAIMLLDTLSCLRDGRTRLLRVIHSAFVLAICP